MEETYPQQVLLFFEHFTLKISKEADDKTRYEIKGTQTPFSDKTRYEIKGTQTPFSDIIELLKYYQEHPISLTFNTIGNPVEDPRVNIIDTERQNKKPTCVCLAVSN